MRARLLCLFVGAWALGASVAAAADPPEMLEARLTEALDAALGPGRARVSIRASGPRRAGRPASAAESSSTRIRETALWGSIVRRMESAPPVLPGYRVPSDLRAEALRSLKEEMRTAAKAAPRESSPGESALSVSLVLDADAGPRPPRPRGGRRRPP